MSTRRVIASGYSATIYIAGDPATARQAIRRYCFDIGLCVTVTETEFIYTGGAEAGVAIGLVDYPRFPTIDSAIQERAEALAVYMLDALCQQSATVHSSSGCVWITRRPHDQ